MLKASKRFFWALVSFRAKIPAARFFFSFRIAADISSAVGGVESTEVSGVALAASAMRTDEADSSDSDRSANPVCRFSTTFRCVVGSSSFSTAMGGEVYCGIAQRFKRSEQVAATRRWSVLLPQSALRYTRQFWTMFHRAETMM